jgi:hypothetical protein
MNVPFCRVFDNYEPVTIVAVHAGWQQSPKRWSLIQSRIQGSMIYAVQAELVIFLDFETSFD